MRCVCGSSLGAGSQYANETPRTQKHVTIDVADVTRVKGSNIRLAQLFVTEHGGTGAWPRLLTHLSPADREVVESAVHVGWYELELQHRVFAALDELLSRPGVSAIADFAWHVAEHDLTRVHRMFLRLAHPAYVLEKAGDYWGRFYDAGSWQVERSQHGARGELSGIAELHPVFCKFIAAYITRMFLLVGAKSGQVVHTRCACRGAPACLFEGHWIE